MTIQPRRRLIFRWTTPRNLLAILLFTILTIVTQYILITYAIPTSVRDPTAITLSPFDITISVLYHILPIGVIITLTTSFTYLTIHTATIPQKIPKKPAPQKTYKKPTRLKLLRRSSKKLQRTARKIKNRILKTKTVTYIGHRITLTKTIIKSATTIIATFIIIILLITIAAYPKLISTATVNFYQWNTAFLTFIITTIKASETIANSIPPIGAVATAVQNALISAAPTFRNTLEAAASAITGGLVSLSSTEKYLIIQNAAAWTVALTTLLHSQYVKTRRYRR